MGRTAPPTSRAARRLASMRRSVGWSAAGLSGCGLLVGLFVAPTDAVQGSAQRLMYLHVPAAWTGYLAFAVVLVASLGYLLRPELRFDRYAAAAAEVGVAATAVAIAAGSVWGRAVWGVWWAWDPRLVSTALLLIVYIGYLAVRRLGDDAHRNARRAAAVGIAAFGLVPVVHFSVVWWRSLHQPATLLAPDPSPPIDPLMAAALLLCVGAATAIATWAFLWRLAAPGTTAEVSATAQVATPAPDLVTTGSRR